MAERAVDVSPGAVKKTRILTALRATPGLSKIGLARILRISPGSISMLVGDLDRQGLVIEYGQDVSTGGRPPAKLRLNPEKPLMLGIDLGETDARMGILNLEGRLIAVERQRFVRQSGAVDLRPIIRAARGLLGRYAAVSGVGVAVPALMDSERGVVRDAPNLGWHELPLKDVLSHELSVPVFVDRNTNAAFLAEEWWGSVQNADPRIFITLGSGIGAAIKAHGELLRGANGAAGEFGHIPMLADGPLCGCGKRGCLEAVASCRALRNRYRELGGRLNAAPSPNDRGRRSQVRIGAIAKSAADGEVAAQQALNEVGEFLGRGIATLINLFNPQLLVMGGELMEAEEVLLPRIRASVASHALSFSSASTTIAVSAFGDLTSLIGAASLGFDSVFHGHFSIDWGAGR